jgi:hypothetical protein
MPNRSTSREKDVFPAPSACGFTSNTATCARDTAIGTALTVQRNAIADGGNHGDNDCDLDRMSFSAKSTDDLRC